MGVRLSNFIDGFQQGVTKHAPELLIGLGVSGMFASIGLAIHATPKAMKSIEKRKEELGVEELSRTEVLKTTWKHYVSTALTATSSAIFIFGANSAHVRRNAALATAYKVSETALAEYREKVIESMGDRKDLAIRDMIAKKHIEENPSKGREVIVTEKGNTLCYDHLSGRYFKSDIDQIQRVVNKLNRDMTYNIGGYVSLNDFYDELEIPRTKLGDDIGWNLDHGLIDIHFGAQIADDGTPCIVLDYTIAPIYNYDKRI
jgi:hypothetical protein